MNEKCIIKVWRFKEGIFSEVRYLKSEGVLYQSFTQNKSDAMVISYEESIRVIKRLEKEKCNRAIVRIFL